MQCRDLMKRDLVFVHPEEPVATAAQLMRQGGIGFLPVVRDGQVAGAITDRDITIRVLAKGERASQRRVGDAMTSSVVSCAPDDNLDAARARMEEAGVGRIMVTEDGQLRGVISIADLASVIAPEEAAATLRKITTEPRPAVQPGA